MLVPTPIGTQTIAFMTAPGTPYPGLSRAVAQAVTRHGRSPDPVERAAGLGELLAALHAEVVAVTHERDDAILEALRTQHLSHRALAARLGLKAQRVDALVRLARGRGRRQPPQPR